MFLHLFVILFMEGGVLSQHALQVVSQHALQQVSRGGLVPGVPAPGGCLVRVGDCSGGVCSGGEPALGGVSTPHPPKVDGYSCGRYASYWYAFLLSLNSGKKFRENSIMVFIVIVTAHNPKGVCVHAYLHAV